MLTSSSSFMLWVYSRHCTCLDLSYHFCLTPLPLALADGHSASMFLNDWARAYRQQLLGAGGKDATSAGHTPVLGSRALMDRSCLLIGSAARLGPASKGLPPSTKGREMVSSSSGRLLTIDIRTTASATAAAAAQSELPPESDAEECETAGAAVVDAPVIRGDPMGRSCLALQQVPAAGWITALGQVKKVGRKV